MENQNKSYYAIIPANVRYDKDLSDKAKLLYGEITALTNEKGYCWATNQYFADLYGCHEKSISRLISQLEKKGYIRTENAKNIFKKIRHIFIIDSNIIVTNESISNKNEDIISNKIEDNISNKNVTMISNKIVTQNNKDINNTINNKINNKKTYALNRSEVESEFEMLWKKYPRKIGKAKAMESYKKARKTKKSSYEKIEQGLYRYIDYIKAREMDEQYIMHGSTWFAQAKWEDEYTCDTIPKKKKFSKFTEMVLSDMENPEEFLNLIGVDLYEQGGNERIILTSEGELS